MAVYDDGTGAALYVGGSFEKAWDTWARTVVKWDGENWNPFPETFGPYSPFIDDIPVARAMTTYDDGTGPALIVGGCFQTVGDLVVNTIAKWDGQEWSALGIGIDDGWACTSYRWAPKVNALAVFDDGSGPALYAGGEFAHAGGAPASNIAMWNGISWYPLGDGVSGPVRALASFDDGSGPALYAAGDFRMAGGAVANAIAKWDGRSWTPVSDGIEDRVYALAVHDDGTGSALYAGGDFTSASGMTASHIARWNGLSWLPVGGGLVGDNGVRTLATFDGGSGPALYAGGRFTGADGVDANRIAMWNGHSWSPVGGGTDPLPYGEVVQALTVFDPGDGPRLFTAGYFQSLGGVYAHGMAQWDGIAWAPMQGPPGGGLNGAVVDLTPGDDGSGPGLFAGGSFTQGGGLPLNRIGKWDGSTWSPLGTGMDGQVRGITFFDDGSGPALFAVGGFATAGDIPANRVAKWNGTIWTPLGNGLGEDRDTVHAVTGIDEGAAEGLYAGGNFDVADGLPAGNIARWDGTSWSEVGGGVVAAIYTLAAFDDGDGTHLYAGGSLRTAGGVAVNGVARWDGATWSPVGDGFSAIVFKLVVVDDGTGPALYAGWDEGIGKWNGAQWVTLGITRPSDNVYGIAYFDDGTGPALFAAGSFYYRTDAYTLSNVAKWDGVAWRGMGYLYAAAYDLAVFDDGNGPGLFFGGDIGPSVSTLSSYIARWISPSLPGELDCDGDIDLDDFLEYTPCFTGPGIPVPPSCEHVDYDHDGDADLADYLEFSNLFTGAR